MTETDLTATANGTGSTAHVDTFDPSGRPVRNAVLALLVLLALIAAVWWSGIVAPRVELEGFSGTYDEATQEGSTTLFVRNKGPLAFEVVGVGGLEGDHEFRLPAAVEIPAGEQAEVLVNASIDCSRPIDSGLAGFELTIRTALGIERRVTDRDSGVAVALFNCTPAG